MERGVRDGWRRRRRGGVLVEVVVEWWWWWSGVEVSVERCKVKCVLSGVGVVGACGCGVGRGGGECGGKLCMGVGESV